MAWKGVHLTKPRGSRLPTANAASSRMTVKSASRSKTLRFVWLFVFFDLPVGTKPDRRWATRFRKFLKDDGFIMLQLSVYARAKNLLLKGSVRTLQVTDRKYARMKLTRGGLVQ